MKQPDCDRVRLRIVVAKNRLNRMKKIIVYARALSRMCAAVPAVCAVVVMAVMQGFVVGPILKNETFLPNLTYNMMRRLFGIKVEFNAASAPIVKNKPVWFVANHMAMNDALVLGSALQGAFAGKAEILEWPGVSQLAQSVKYIGIRRDKQHNPQSRANLIKNFNAGHNVIMFPEATTTDGKEVKMFHAGLITLLFGDKGVNKKKKEVVLQKEVVVQPVALRVKEINGKNAIGNDKLRNLYSMPDHENILTVVWKQMQVRSTTIELTAFPPLEPGNFKGPDLPPDASDEEKRTAAVKSAVALINQAAVNIASVVNPGQTIFEKPVIPGQKKRPHPPEKGQK